MLQGALTGHIIGRGQQQRAGGFQILDEGVFDGLVVHAADADIDLTLVAVQIIGQHGDDAGAVLAQGIENDAHAARRRTACRARGRR